MRFSSILVLLLFLASCGEDEAPAVDLFSATLQSNAIEQAEARWLVAYNDNGEVLAHQDVTAVETVKLSSNRAIPGNKITVALIYHYNNGGNKSYSVTAFTDVTPGESLNFIPTSLFPPGPQLGNVTVNMSTSAGFSNFTVTDKFGFLLGGQSGGGNVSYTSTLYSDKLNFMYRAPSTLKHKLVTGAKNNDVFTFTPTDLVDYDTKVTFQFPAGTTFYFMSNGYESDWTYPKNGYILDIHSSLLNESTTITTGYISSLAKFTTNIVLNYPGNMGATYFKFGAIPSPAIAWPDPPRYVVTNKNIDNFASTSDKAITYRVSRFNSDITNRVNWSITSPSLTHKLQELPLEILTAHPDLSLSKVQHVETKFYTSGENYSDYIGQKYKGAAVGDVERIGVIRR
jgi:hypothetical protein